MELAEQRAPVADAAQDAGRRRLERRCLGGCEVARQQCGHHVGAQRVAPGEEAGAAWRAFRGGPGVAKQHAAPGERVQAWRPGRCQRSCSHTAITEQGHLVDADVIHHHEEDVGPCHRLGLGDAGAPSQPGHDCGQDHQTSEHRYHLGDSTDVSQSCAVHAAGLHAHRKPVIAFSLFRKASQQALCDGRSLMSCPLHASALLQGQMPVTGAGCGTPTGGLPHR